MIACARLRDERDALVAAMRHADADVEQVASVLNRLFYKLEYGAWVRRCWAVNQLHACACVYACVCVYVGQGGQGGRGGHYERLCAPLRQDEGAIISQSLHASCDAQAVRVCVDVHVRIACVCVLPLSLYRRTQTRSGSSQSCWRSGLWWTPK